MSSCCRSYCHSSIIKKQAMGISGLLLCGFLVSHLAGNTLIYVGPEAFNKYAHTLITNPFIYVAEAILVLIFLSHIFMGIRLTLENSRARPEKYFIRERSGRGATIFSSTMIYTGTIILAFLVYHLIKFKYGPNYVVIYQGQEMRDLYKLMIEYFSQPSHVAIYIVAMMALGAHVKHGFWSAFQSLGINHPRYNCCIRIAATIFAILISAGYSALPIFCYMQGGH